MGRYVLGNWCFLAQQDFEVLDDIAKLMGVGDSTSSSFCAASVQLGRTLTDGCPSPPVLSSKA